MLLYVDIASEWHFIISVISTQLERAEGKCATYVKTEVINCFQAPLTACLHIMHVQKLSFQLGD